VVGTSGAVDWLWLIGRDASASSNQRRDEKRREEKRREEEEQRREEERREEERREEERREEKRGPGCGHCAVAGAPVARSIR
jgi:hypothetical protein